MKWFIVAIMMAGTAGAADFSDLQRMNAAAAAGRAAAAGGDIPAPGWAPAVREEGARCIAQLRLVPKDAARFNAIVDDEAVAAALRAEAAKYCEGEANLMNVKFIDAASFVVGDLMKRTDGSYSAGQFAPRLTMPGDGKARLTLTYFRWNNYSSYSYAEVASFELETCGGYRAPKEGGLENMSEQEWLRFVRTVREREYDDDHLTDEEREAVLKEWLRRNPADKDKLTGYLHLDFVNLVLEPAADKAPR